VRQQYFSPNLDTPSWELNTAGVFWVHQPMASQDLLINGVLLVTPGLQYRACEPLLAAIKRDACLGWIGCTARQGSKLTSVQVT
jgi:hypothetical protein